MSRPRVFVTQPVAQSAIDRIAAIADITVNQDASRILPKAQLIEAVRNADILFCLLHDTIDHDVIAANPRLRAIASQAITPDRIDLKSATRFGIPVTVVPPIATDASADIAFALLLAVARRVVEGTALVRKGVFPGSQSAYLLGSDVTGKTIGLIGGKGRIGQAVARRARGFDMHVLYCGPNRLPADEEKGIGFEYCAFDELIAQSDFVSVHAALSPQTRHLVGEREFKRMKPGAFFINTARGAIVDEAALARALETGEIAGAGLDVFEHEPEIEPALLSMPNVVLTPHLGSAARDVREAMANIVADNIVAIIESRTPPNCANPETLREPVPGLDANRALQTRSK
jgi:glyoxylate reductase